MNHHNVVHFLMDFTCTSLVQSGKAIASKENLFNLFNRKINIEYFKFVKYVNFIIKDLVRFNYYRNKNLIIWRKHNFFSREVLLKLNHIH
jgi:hypothetical protein